MGDGDPAALARVFHADGFVALDRAQFGLSDAQVTRVAAAVQTRYEQFLAVAERHAIDLSSVANAERIPGFYVRQGGRIDMELVTTKANVPGASAVAKSLVADVQPVDLDLFRGLEANWKSVVDEVFQADESSGRSSQYELEYIGCVVARPGDGDQNWHLDGVHRNLTQHEPEIGGTEMKRASQFHDDGRRGSAFGDYAELESVTHYVAAGTPVVMDYRVWHRGRANDSVSVLRPLLYFKYTRKDSEAAPSGKRTQDAVADDSEKKTTKKKRVALFSVSNTEGASLRSDV